jgi:hypothetical protein
VGQSAPVIRIIKPLRLKANVVFENQGLKKLFFDARSIFFFKKPKFPWKFARGREI